MDFVLSQFCICALGADDAERGEKKSFQYLLQHGIGLQQPRSQSLSFAMVPLTLVSNGRNSCRVVDMQFSVWGITDESSSASLRHHI